VADPPLVPPPGSLPPSEIDPQVAGPLLQLVGRLPPDPAPPRVERPPNVRPVPNRAFWLSFLRRLRQRRSVILGYHGVADCPLSLDLSRLQVAPVQFERQVELLSKAGFRFMTMSEAADELGSGRPRPGIAVVTFDDGLRNNYTTALPILSRLGIRATVYVACNFIGGYNPWVSPGGGGEMLGEEDIRALAASGWEIGAHTLSHPNMASLDYEQCRAEIEASRQRLETIIGSTVDTFAYPFGLYGAEAVRAVRDAGMRAAVTTGSGIWDRLELTRAMVSNGDPYAIVALKMLDGYAPLLRTPPLRAARAMSLSARGALRAR
jgi:peptidoglycan/xylan/chitin deacetylase (PgdA/CDA1 family)